VVVWRAFAGEVRQEDLLAGALELCLRGGRQLGLLPAGDIAQPVEAVGGRQDHPHLVPGAGNGVAEGVYGTFGIGAEAVVGDEERARGAEGDEALARTDGADAAGGGGIVAGP